MVRIQYLVLWILCAWMFACRNDHGTFAFHAVDDTKLTAFERKIHTPVNFKKYGPPVQFNENQNLWFAYKPGKVNFERPYAVSLSKKSLGWIEIDLKNLRLSPEIGYLVDNYPEIKNGRYLLTVAFDNAILDSVEFEIINERDQREDYIDYDLPLSVVLDSEVDDLRILSRE